MGRATCMVTLLGVSAILAASPAAAQDALGAGDVLDAGLSRTGGRRNLPIQRVDYRARNLLVTGNVAGGRGFRESVGYAAAGDFLGQLGSDELYGFRAGSAFSALPYISLGNTYERLRFGREMSLVEYPRAGYGSTIRDVEMPRFTISEVQDIQLRLDRLSRASSIGSLAERDAQASAAGTAAIVDESGQQTGLLFLNLSSLRGVVPTESRQQVQLLGLTEYDKAQMFADLDPDRPLRPMGVEFEARAIDLAQQSERVEAEMTQARIDLEQTPDYKQILERVAARYAQTDQFDLQIEESLLAELDLDLEKLRRELIGLETEPGSETTGQPPQDEATPADRTGLPDIVASPPGRRERTGDGDETGPPSVERLSMALRHGEIIRKLTASEEDRLARLLASGEQYLREGEYFWAERRFERASQFAPGHPLATAGMAHSQLGAGLYLSASLTLRKLLTGHPEMIDTRYEEGLLPSREHLLKAVDKIRQRRDTEASARGSNGFLLAYIGHHLDDRALIEEGLSLMADALPGDPLRLLLEKVWLAEPEGEPELEQAEPAIEPEK
ncbi:MAG: hypothetical protein JSV91_02645 [Phycisphaerales bacterium]|nr:MAG: hypothetical protein JSV91_02645 [Phycisphaerales bacterium]